MHRKILQSGRVCADETTLKMQAPDKAKTCWLWAVRGLADALPKSPLGKAINYTLDRWPCLVRLLDDGAMPIDNNALERDIRPVAIGRKNWLFAGSPRGGRAAAIFFTLIESCKRAGHNTFEYMKDVLARIRDHPVNRLDELLPDRWKPGG